LRRVSTVEHGCGRAALVDDLVVAWAIGAAMLVLVAVPLLTWWVGGRGSWREPPTADAYVPLQMARRHGLRPAELPVVERAASWGREMRDDRQRAAVVELAQRQVRPGRARRLPPLWLVLIYSALGALLVGFLVAKATQGQWPVGNWLDLAVLLVYGVVGWRWQTGPARAIRLNSAPPMAAGDGRADDRRSSEQSQRPWGRPLSMSGPVRDCLYRFTHFL
jgi:uncharacterized membrane protein YqjE